MFRKIPFVIARTTIGMISKKYENIGPFQLTIDPEKPRNQYVCFHADKLRRIEADRFMPVWSLPAWNAWVELRRTGKSSLRSAD